MRADDQYTDETWAPGNPALRGAGRKDEAPGFTPEHRPRADELPNRVRAEFGLTDDAPDPVVFADEVNDAELERRRNSPLFSDGESVRRMARAGRLEGVPFLACRKENYSVGRQGYDDIWFILHCTDDEYSDRYPENLGKYWGREVTKVSVHFGVSDTMTRQYVDMNNTAWQARNPGNLRGVGVELSGLSSWTRAQWLEHRPMIRRAAQLCLDVSRARGYGNPAGSLATAATLKSRARGVTQHRDLTSAFGGTHSDLGASFPWDVFAAELKALQAPAPAPAKPANPTPKPAAPEVAVPLTDEMIARWKGQLDAIDDTVRGGKGNAYKGSVLRRDLDQLTAVVAAQTAAYSEVVRKLVGGEAISLADVERVAYEAAARALAEQAPKP